jgi:hypothetical protein
MHDGDVFDGIDVFVKQWNELVVNFHCGDKCASFCKRKREGSEARSNLENVTVVIDVGEAGDLSHRVGIDNKVLPKGTLCTKTRAF